MQDAAYLTQVPQFCPESPIPEESPVFGCVWDSFTIPLPFRADAAIPIDDVIDEKCHLLDCQVSQFYEWLPWEMNLELHRDKMTWEEVRSYLTANWGSRYIRAANEARQVLTETFGEAGNLVRYAECFELSPYGRGVSKEEFRKLLLGKL